MRKRMTSLLLTLVMLLSLVPAMGVTASAAGTEIEAVSFSYTGYAEGKNVADAVVTCNTAGVDFTYKWQYSDSGGSYSDATKLSAQFISGIKYTLWIYFKAQDGLALAELNETDVTLGGNNPGVVYTNYTIDEVKYSYGVPFSMSPLGGVTKYIVGFYTQGGKIGEESYRVERVTGTDGKLTAEQVPTPTKEHYTFDGWYETATFDKKFDFNTPITNSMTLYAKWTENKEYSIVSGTIKSYNPNNATTIQLMQGGEVKYTATIAATTDSGQVEQNFSFDAVAKGTYDLVVTKPGHLSYTVKNVEVGGTDLDLTTLTGKAYSTITLLCGDIDGDGWIDFSDYQELLKSTNYGKQTSAVGVNKIADLDGDTWIDFSDYQILLSSQHYGKSTVSVNFGG